MFAIRNQFAAISALLSLSVLPFIFIGCASRPAPLPASGVSTGATAVSTGTHANVAQFLAALKALPPDQRTAYVQTHSDMVAQVMQGSDPNDQIQYRDLMLKK